MLFRSVRAIQDDLERNKGTLKLLFKRAEDRTKNLRRAEVEEHTQLERYESNITDPGEDAESDTDEILESLYGRVNVFLEGQLGFVIHEDELQTKEQILERSDLFFFSTTLH